MFCPNCGNQLPDHAKFCNVCGNPVPQKMTPPAPAPVPPVQAVPQPETPPVPPYQAYQAPPQPQSWQAPPQPQSWQAPPQPQTWQAPPQPQTYQAPPQPQYQAYQAPPPQFYQPVQETPAPVPPLTPPPEKTAEERPAFSRDGRGKYILKRLIFCAIAVVVGILIAIISSKAGPIPVKQVKIVPPPQGFQRGLMTVGMILIPLVISFAVTMLAGLAKGNGGKNAVRIISAVLRSLTPIALALLLIDLLVVKTNYLPISMMASRPAAWVIPVLTLALPLTGFLMNAAVQNGHDTTFGKSLGAAAHWAADRMPAIVVSAIAIEAMFSGRGLGSYLMQSIMQYQLGRTAAVLIFFAVLVYLLKFLMDVLAALLSGGDPAEQVYAARSKEDRSGKALFLIGAIFAGTVLLFAAVAPFITGDPAKMSAQSINLLPGVKGHLFGTDQFGRDVFTVSVHGLRNTILLALTNTALATALGIGFGVLAGFLPKGASEIFKGLRYVLGFGAPLALFLILLIGKESYGTAPFFVIGLFTWGGIAERIGYGIKARKAAGPGKTALILPALEQLVHTFCAAIVGRSLIGFLGLMTSNPRFLTLGMLISSGRQVVGRSAYAGLTPAVMLIILLLAFYLMHAGLCAMERHLKAEE